MSIFKSVNVHRKWVPTAGKYATGEELAEAARGYFDSDRFINNVNFYLRWPGNPFQVTATRQCGQIKLRGRFTEKSPEFNEIHKL